MLKTRSLFNYINDLLLNAIDRYMEMYFDYKIQPDPMLSIHQESANHQARYGIPEIAQKMYKAEYNESSAVMETLILNARMLFGMDVVYLFQTEMMFNETVNLFHEPLLLYSSFETLEGENNYFPLVDPMYPVAYFEYPHAITERRYWQNIAPVKS